MPAHNFAKTMQPLTLNPPSPFLLLNSTSGKNGKDHNFLLLCDQVLANAVQHSPVCAFYLAAVCEESLEGVKAEKLLVAEYAATEGDQVLWQDTPTLLPPELTLSIYALNFTRNKRILAVHRNSCLSFCSPLATLGFVGDEHREVLTALLTDSGVLTVSAGPFFSSVL